jgi:hypothetical protein
MGNRRVHRVLLGKSEGKRTLERPNRRWGEYIKMDIQRWNRETWTG